MSITHSRILEKRSFDRYCNENSAGVEMSETTNYTLNSVVAAAVLHPHPYCNLMAKCRKFVFRSLKLQANKRQTRMRNTEMLTVQGSKEGAV